MPAKASILLRWTKRSSRQASKAGYKLVFYSLHELHFNLQPIVNLDKEP